MSTLLSNDQTFGQAVKHTLAPSTTPSGARAGAAGKVTTIALESLAVNAATALVLGLAGVSVLGASAAALTIGGGATLAAIAIIGLAAAIYGYKKPVDATLLRKAQDVTEAKVAAGGTVKHDNAKAIQAGNETPAGFSTASPKELNAIGVKAGKFADNLEAYGTYIETKLVGKTRTQALQLANEAVEIALGFRTDEQVARSAYEPDLKAVIQTALINAEVQNLALRVAGSKVEDSFGLTDEALKATAEEIAKFDGAPVDPIIDALKAARTSEKVLAEVQKKQNALVAEVNKLRDPENLRDDKQLFAAVDAFRVLPAKEDELTALKAKLEEQLKDLENRKAVQQASRSVGVTSTGHEAVVEGALGEKAQAWQEAAIKLANEIETAQGALKATSSELVEVQVTLGKAADLIRNAGSLNAQYAKKASDAQDLLDQWTGTVGSVYTADELAAPVVEPEVVLGADEPAFTEAAHLQALRVAVELKHGFLAAELSKSFQNTRREALKEAMIELGSNDVNAESDIARLQYEADLKDEGLNKWILDVTQTRLAKLSKPVYDKPTLSVAQIVKAFS